MSTESPITSPNKADGSGQVFSEYISYSPSGALTIDGVDCAELASTHGTPLYVISENQIRENIRKFREAFRSRYPRSRVLFATKANNNLAVRRVYTDAGAGAECFGYGELLVSLKAGTPPSNVVLNGFIKQEAELRLAIESGVTIHLDSVNELSTVSQLASEYQKTVRIGVRTRLMMHALDAVRADWPGPGDPPEGHSIGESMREKDKFGVSEIGLRQIVEQVKDDPWLVLAGLHNHVGRENATTMIFEEAVREQVQLAARIRDEFGWVPEYFDFGGGMAFGRPEGHGPLGHDKYVPTYDQYAEAMVTTFIECLQQNDLGNPELVIEPGRAVASNTGILLSTVGIVKYVPETEQTWVGVDAGQNHLLNNLTGAFYYHPVPLQESSRSTHATVNVADPQCWYGNLAMDAALPRLSVGDRLAFLDTGAYCESKAMNFNLNPRPATVLVSAGQSDVVTRRETLDDVLSRVQVPERLMKLQPTSPAREMAGRRVAEGESF